MRTTPVRQWILLSLVLGATLTMAACTEARPTSSVGSGDSNQVGASATAGIPATPSPSAAASAQPAGSHGVPECRNTDIHVSSLDGGGAAGHVAVLLTFVNESGHTCYLQGFPAVSLVDAHGNVLLWARSNLNGFIGGSIASSRGLSLTAPPRVVLTPVLSAEAVLEWEDVNPIQGVPGGCRVPQSAAILVTPPGSTRASRLAGLKDACDAVQIGPVISQTGAPA